MFLGVKITGVFLGAATGAGYWYTKSKNVKSDDEEVNSQELVKKNQ